MKTSAEDASYRAMGEVDSRFVAYTKDYGAAVFTTAPHHSVPLGKRAPRRELKQPGSPGLDYRAVVTIVSDRQAAGWSSLRKRPEASERSGLRQETLVATTGHVVRTFPGVVPAPSTVSGDNSARPQAGAFLPWNEASGFE